MKTLYSLLLLSANLWISEGFLDDNARCMTALSDTYSECQAFFTDIHKLESIVSTLQTTVASLQTDVELLSIRLTNGTSYRGTVELFTDGHWGAICDEHWDLNDANVVCHMLGYSRARTMMSGHVTTAPYLTSNVNCGGTEKSIFQCSRMQSFLNFGCDYNRAAGVDCEMGIRLVGSTQSDRGRVEIQHLGEWGTICDPSWTSADAEVVCRMMGLRGGRAVSQATFGAGTGRIILSNVVCSGNEAHLMDCRHSPFRVHTCNHSQDVSVVCDGQS